MNAEQLVMEVRNHARESGHTLIHDIEHGSEVLARAGACYADCAASDFEGMGYDFPHPFWPDTIGEMKEGMGELENMAEACAFLQAAIDVLLVNAGLQDAPE